MCSGSEMTVKWFLQCDTNCSASWMLGVLVPVPLQCHNLSGLHWDGDRAVSAQQDRGITRLFVEEAETKVIILACPERIGNLWQRNRTLT